MTGKIDPRKLSPLAFPAMPNPSVDWTDNATLIRQALGESRLSPVNRLRLDSGWKYSPAAVEHFTTICRQFFRHSKGQWAGKPIEWTPWQLTDWVRPIFGWYREDRVRGVNKVYIECGKKSGKSTFAATVAAYFSRFMGEGGAECYNLASTKDQAKIVQRQVEELVAANNDLELRCRMVRGDRITWPDSNSVIQCLSGKGMSGPNPFLLVMDELHEWTNSKSFDKWTYGSAVRLGWLHLAITNSGDDEESVCFRQRTYAQKVMAGEVDAPEFHGRIYTAGREQAEAEIEAVAGGATRLPVAYRCNPGLGTIIPESFLLSQIREALQNPSLMANLLRFFYCIWRTAARNEWLVRHWDTCRQDYDLASLADGANWLALDMSSVTDLTALAMVSKAWDGSRPPRIWPWFWVPRMRALELRKWTAIEQWEADGDIHVCDGERINQDAIVQTICEVAQTHQVRALLYDPKGAQSIINEVQKETGVEVIPFSQSHESYHEATDNFEADIKAAELEHPGHPILAWQAKHASCVSTTHGYKKPLKPDQTGAPHKTVDGIQAAVMAYSQAIHWDADSEEIVIYEMD